MGVEYKRRVFYTVSLRLTAIPEDAMKKHLTDCFNNKIPAWIFGTLIILILTWFTFSPAIMMMAAVGWSVLYWLVAYSWCFLTARKPPADQQSS